MSSHSRPLLTPGLSLVFLKRLISRRRFKICHAGSREERSKWHLEPPIRSEAGQRHDPAIRMERVIHARGERGKDAAGGGRERGMALPTEFRAPLRKETTFSSHHCLPHLLLVLASRRLKAPMTMTVTQ